MCLGLRMATWQKTHGIPWPSWQSRDLGTPAWQAAGHVLFGAKMWLERDRARNQVLQTSPHIFGGIPYHFVGYVYAVCGDITNIL